MSKTKLQFRMERIGDILAEYRFSVEPLKSAVIRKEIAWKIATEIRSQESGVRTQKAESGKRKAEGRKQKTTR